MNWYLECLKKYAVFSGRAQRMEYWMFVLFYVIFAIALGIVESIIGLGGEGGGLLSGLFVLGMLIPSLAVTVRRLHDTDHSAMVVADWTGSAHRVDYSLHFHGPG